ncbi:MAG: hypothetical protein H7A21_10405 [Spirochaetales bacterium]|nr:hypothetical protein [Leptospiraceae bacterium]MCP5481833.1 hypothetical protein [Spirochaetales bacterium]
MSLRTKIAGLLLVMATPLYSGACLARDCVGPACDTLGLAFLYSYFVDTFVAVGQNGAVRTSYDGRTWTTRNLAVQLQAASHGNGLLYASGLTDTAYVSANGQSWTQLASLNTGTSDTYFSIASLNGILVAGGSAGSGQVRRSSDGGQSWTNLTNSPASSEVGDLEVGDGVLRGVTGGGHFLQFNSDASSYSFLTPTGATALTALAYESGVWVVCGPGGYVARTADDGATWSNQILNATHALEGVAYGNGRFVVAGHDGTNTQVWTSTDGGFTFAQSSPPFGRTRGIAYGGGVFVIAGNGGLLAYSATPEVSGSWVDVSTGSDHSFDIVAALQSELQGIVRTAP